MIFLGQSFYYMSEGKKIPCVYLGVSGVGANSKWVVVDTSLKEVFFDALGELHLVRDKDTKSPSGKKIYYGGCKKEAMGNMKMKSPSEEKLKEEFNEIRKRI